LSESLGIQRVTITREPDAAGHGAELIPRSATPRSLFSASKAAITSTGTKMHAVQVGRLHAGDTIGPGLLHKILRDSQLTADQ